MGLNRNSRIVAQEQVRALYNEDRAKLHQIMVEAEKEAGTNSLQNDLFFSAIIRRMIKAEMEVDPSDLDRYKKISIEQESNHCQHA